MQGGSSDEGAEDADSEDNNLNPAIGMDVVDSDHNSAGKI